MKPKMKLILVADNEVVATFDDLQTYDLDKQLARTYVANWVARTVQMINENCQPENEGATS
jgi:hypothetical protein